MLGTLSPQVSVSHVSDKPDCIQLFFGAGDLLGYVVDSHPLGSHHAENCVVLFGLQQKEKIIR